MFFELVETGPGGEDLASGVLLYLRAGGFMLGVPAEEVVHDTLLAMAIGAGAEEPVFGSGQVQMESSQGRRLGTSLVELVDLPWALVQQFSVLPRLGGLRGPGVLQFTCGGASARPIAHALAQLADAWIQNGELAEDTAQEYMTAEDWEGEIDGEELGEEELFPQDEPAAPREGGAAAAATAKLQGRIRELERQLAVAQSTRPSQRVPPAGGRGKGPALFNIGEGAGLTAVEWTRLQRLAGAPPPRIGAAEGRRPALTTPRSRRKPTNQELSRQRCWRRRASSPRTHFTRSC